MNIRSLGKVSNTPSSKRTIVENIKYPLSSEATNEDMKYVIVDLIEKIELGSRSNTDFDIVSAHSGSKLASTVTI